MKYILTITILILLVRTTSAQWVHYDNPSGLHNYYCNFYDEMNGVVTDEHNAYWITHDGGLHWSMDTPITQINNPFMISPDTMLGIKWDTGMYKSIDAGQSWNLICPKPAPDFFPSSFYFTPDHQKGFMFWSGTGFPTYDLKIYYSNDRGNTWNNIFTGTYNSGPGSMCQKIDFADSLNGYLVTGWDLWKTTDGGQTWSVVSTFWYPVLSFAVATDSTVVLNIYQTDSLYRTTNSGQSWVVSLPPAGGIHYDIDFVTSTVGFLCGGNGISNGYILRTTNGGLTWAFDHSDNNTYISLSFPSINCGYAAGENSSVVKNRSVLDIEEQSKNTWIIFPNPSSEFISLNRIAEYDLFDFQSHLIKSNISESLDVRELSSGIYFLKCRNTNEVRKIVVQH